MTYHIKISKDLKTEFYFELTNKEFSSMSIKNNLCSFLINGEFYEIKFDVYSLVTQPYFADMIEDNLLLSFKVSAAEYDFFLTDLQLSNIKIIFPDR